MTIMFRIMGATPSSMASQRTMAGIRKAIEEDRFLEHKEEFYKKYGYIK